MTDQLEINEHQWKINENQSKQYPARGRRDRGRAGVVIGVGGTFLVLQGGVWPVASLRGLPRQPVDRGRDVASMDARLGLRTPSPRRHELPPRTRHARAFSAQGCYPRGQIGNPLGSRARLDQ